MPPRIALTVATNSPDTVLSPFFRFAPWLMVTDQAGTGPKFLRNEDQTDDALVDLICGQSPDILISGFISVSAAKRLADTGIEIRIGPCSVPGRTLMSEVDRLPTAPQVLDFEAREVGA